MAGKKLSRLAQTVVASVRDNLTASGIQAVIYIYHPDKDDPNEFAEGVTTTSPAFNEDNLTALRTAEDDLKRAAKFRKDAATPDQLAAADRLGDSAKAERTRAQGAVDIDKAKAEAEVKRLLLRAQAAIKEASGESISVPVPEGALPPMTKQDVQKMGGDT